MITLLLILCWGLIGIVSVGAIFYFVDGEVMLSDLPMMVLVGILGPVAIIICLSVMAINSVTEYLKKRDITIFRRNHHGKF